MSNDAFLSILQEEARHFAQAVATEEGDWIVKGFIDVYKRIYTMPGDTKVVSKVIELFLIPKLVQFAEQNDYSVVLASQQNFYPDVSFVSKYNKSIKYAIDIKSTYRSSATTVNGLTLGAFTGYFRNRMSTKNIVFPYSDYKAHLVLGAIYSKAGFFESKPTKQASLQDTGESGKIALSEKKTYSLEEIDKIGSVIKDLMFFVQPKYKIATARPGSGNTRNIGSVANLEQLVNGIEPFSDLGEEIYDDYWMNYLNADMARKAELRVPYNNLESYARYKNIGKAINIEQARQLDQSDSGLGAEGEE